MRFIIIIIMKITDEMFKLKKNGLKKSMLVVGGRIGV